MKATIRVPTVQFGYIEYELDEKELGENGGAVSFHNKVVAMYEKTKEEVQKIKDDNF